MSREHVDHKEIARFAHDRVNLSADRAKKYRQQASTLRDRLGTYLKEHPDFSLKKMLLSGSLAKGTALRTLNDIDVACYVSGADAPKDVAELIKYLAERLRKAFPNFSDDQVQPKTYCVTVSFKGTVLDVDVVPILYYGDENWYGELVNQSDGAFLETCIPRHLEFIRKRKSENETHFAQIIRLIKYWNRLKKQENDSFRFKSFMIELILAKLADDGCDLSDYPEALQGFFTYIAESGLSEEIIFTDYYAASKVDKSDDPVQIYDPVNAENNVASLYTAGNVDLIVDAALDAGDAIEAALRATTKSETVRYWRKVFGPSFSV